MANHWHSDLGRHRSFGGFTDEPASDRIPGVPRGSGVLAPLGSLIGGALTGVALGVSAGPLGMRIGAGAGAFIGLLAYLAATRTRRQTADVATPTRDEPNWTRPQAAEPRGVSRARSRRALRFVTLLTRWVFGVLAALAAVFSGLLISAGAPDDSTAMYACATFGIALFAAGYAFLIPLPPPAPSRHGGRR